MMGNVRCLSTRGCFFIYLICASTEFVHLNTRSGVELGNNGEENEDCDSVELEKSNVLLMGPTGSGTKYEFDFFFLSLWY